MRDSVVFERGAAVLAIVMSQAGIVDCCHDLGKRKSGAEVSENSVPEESETGTNADSLEKLETYPVLRMPPVKQISSTFGHACAVTQTGSLMCWGDNEYGQLGDGTTIGKSDPTLVGGLSDVKQVATGTAHTCALTGGGSVYCWGNNSLFQLGDGSNAERHKPVRVSVEDSLKSVWSGAATIYALTSSGRLWRWGNIVSGYDQGGSRASSERVPILYPDWPKVPGVVDVTVGSDHTCALADNGVLCWGGNRRHQISDANWEFAASPTGVVGLYGSIPSENAIRELSAGAFHTCAITARGEVKCWGENSDGQLGNGSKDATTAMVTPDGLRVGAKTVTAGVTAACAVSSNGEVLCWGNQYGPVPKPVPEAGKDAKQLVVGQCHACVLTYADTVRCWGDYCGVLH